MNEVAASWFRRRTFSHRRFADLPALVEAKRGQGVTVSVCIPTINEAATVGAIVRAIRRSLVEAVPLVDEIVVIDSASSDGTAGAAEAAGATVYQEAAILPGLEPFSGKGEALWKSLFAARGDLILWLDGDISDFDLRFVYGPLGPLLADPSIGYVKGFYDRPVTDGEGSHPVGGGRVTELVARPLINLFWPHLAGLIQPLSGEYAGRRSLLQQVPFLTGYGVELGLIVDIAERFGLDAMAQVDLDSRVHRHRSIAELSRMASAVMQAALARLDAGGQVDLRTVPESMLVQFSRDAGGYRGEPSMVAIRERPPAVTVSADGALA